MFYTQLPAGRKSLRASSKRWLGGGRSNRHGHTEETVTDHQAPASKYAAYAAAEPYFALVRGALGDRVEGAHFFDVVADDVIYEVLYELGWPRLIRGRADLINQFGGYGQAIKLHAADNLITHIADNGGTIVIEYEVHGTILATGAAYDNRFCSIIQIENRKITHWRDYMDSLAAWNALTREAD
jgi:ketosteroid isomerase-like protein